MVDRRVGEMTHTFHCKTPSPWFFPDASRSRHGSAWALRGRSDLVRVQEQMQVKVEAPTQVQMQMQVQVQVRPPDRGLPLLCPICASPMSKIRGLCKIR